MKKITGDKPDPSLVYEDELLWLKRVYGAERAKKIWDACKPQLRVAGKKLGTIIYGTKK